MAWTTTKTMPITVIATTTPATITMANHTNMQDGQNATIIKNNKNHWLLLMQISAT